jgi:hypothetical protein
MERRQQIGRRVQALVAAAVVEAAGSLNAVAISKPT